MRRLVVVSNRVPLPRGAKPPEGGLATALLAALESRGGLWYGWNGTTTTETMPGIEYARHGAVEFATLPLTRRDYDEYYKGYSNRVLWPLFHLRLDRMEYRRNFEEGYRRVNQLFARRLLPLLGPEDSIWIHDYHLIPLGKELLRAGCRSPLGFFLHVPFPPYDVLRALPRYRTLLLELLAYDLVGFHTELDLQGFQNSVLLGLPGSTSSSGEIGFESHRTLTGVFPISIDVEDVRREARRARASPAGRRLIASLKGRRLIMGVDRLDYSKGLVERFRAFERLLERQSALRGIVVLLQVAQPSRGDVPEYESMRRELNAVTGEINGRFAEYDWAPIRYLNKGLARATVLGFLSIAEIGLVTPLRDGMNLVAKEFVAAQEPESAGVLVLSDLAGAARELDSGAVIVNPFDMDDIADGLVRALSMPLEERKERWQSMLDAVRRNDIHRWRSRFLEALDRARPTAPASDCYTVGVD
ncbi:MAG: alpha,alpha-trehalose-phosphate synthase (UDP-forming) [Vicinamibacteria bacterium]